MYRYLKKTTTLKSTKKQSKSKTNKNIYYTDVANGVMSKALTKYFPEVEDPEEELSKDENEPRSEND